MFKVLTVFFIMYYGYELINQHKETRMLIDKFSKLYNGEMADDYTTVEYLENNPVEVVKFLGVCLGIIAIAFIEMFYIGLAFSYGNFYVVLVYLIFWIAEAVIERIISKRNPNRKMTLDKYSMKQMIINLIDLAFFVYMFVQLI